MRNVFITVALFVAFSCTNEHRNAGDSERSEINKTCDQVVDLIAKGDSKQGINKLKQISVMTPSDLDSLGIKVENQMESLLPSYGRLIGVEFMREFKSKDILARRNYILKFERYYLRTSLTLYKTPAGWKVTNFDYNDDLTEILY